MFERLIERGRAVAERAAERRRERLAETMAEEAPRGVCVRVEGEAVALAGRRLLRRYVLDPAMRRLVERRR